MTNENQIHTRNGIYAYHLFYVFEKPNTHMKKIITSILVIALFLGQLPVGAQEFPTPPSAPTAPASPEPPTPPQSPSSPTAPNAPSTPTLSDASPTPEPTPTPRERRQDRSSSPEPTPSQDSSTQSTQQNNQSQPTNTQPSQQNGETRIITGDATGESIVITTGNSNQYAGTQSNEHYSGSIATTGNDADSKNTTLINNQPSSAMIQDNTAAVNTDLNQSTTTGNNSASGNVSNSFIKTGNANVSGTVITSMNTNVDGVMVSEFTVADDHRGDIVLQFAPSCVSGCNQGGTIGQTHGNGVDSTNTTTITNSSNDTTFQNNDATIGNTLTLSANSGNNMSSENTGGESVIYTGNANVSANLLTFANNNIQGNVLYGVVNIYGNLVGDIIFPEEYLMMAPCCEEQPLAISTANNGANSTNTTAINTSTTDTTIQSNDAIIENTLILNAQTGNNETTGNTSGDNRVITGNANIDANVVNIANSNITDGNFWLVIINEAGKWIGRIIGGNGSNIAGSEGFLVATDEHGNIIATTGNSANSINTTTIDNESNQTTTQTNTAVVKNTLNLSANTGTNQANNNTGGNSSIVTGDANIIANMVNFVNNNITGTGRLFVTVVNVFGSWIGDFIAPGHKKQTQTITENQTQEQSLALGGTNATVSITVDSSSQSSNNTNTTTIASVTTTSSQEKLPDGIIRLTRRSTVQRASRSTTNGEALHSNTIIMEEENAEINGFSTIDAPEATITPIVAGKRVVRINLAWLIFLIPIGIILFILKKMTQKNQA